MLPLEDLYGDLWFSLRDHENLEVFWVMLSLDVFRRAGDICKTFVNTMKYVSGTLVNVTHMKRSLLVVLATYCLR